ncbi:MAG: hypothetical protein ACREMI_13950 [Gemmatimonadales bacterium]
MSILFLSLAAIFVLRGPFGRALAERIAGRSRGVDDQEIQDLKGEVEELRHQLGDVQERLDFAERLLARQDERVGALPKRGRE